HSDSLKQLSFRSPAWAMAGTEVSLSAGEAAISKADGFVSSTQQHRAGGGGEAQNWGLWHEGGGAGGGADMALEGSSETEVEGHRSPTAASGRRPGTTSDCLPAANTPKTTTVANRPQTSPSVVFLADTRGSGSETEGGRKSPPRRMHS
ncbi:unnamed protein product, partial [Ectocarpus sp. 12 AP-2014]